MIVYFGRIIYICLDGVKTRMWYFLYLILSGWLVWISTCLDPYNGLLKDLFIVDCVMGLVLAANYFH